VQVKWDDARSILTVTFRYTEELKNRVKSIRGARWNSEERFWYFTADAASAAVLPLKQAGFSVPAVETGPGAGDMAEQAPAFAPSSPSDSASPSTSLSISASNPPFRASSAEPSRSSSLTEPEDLTVDAVHLRARDAVERELSGSVWVVGVLQNVRIRGQRNFLFLELVDDIHASRPLALSLFVSGPSLRVVEFSMRDAGLELTDGLRVRVSGRVTLNRRHQVQLNVSGIDARYSLGELALRRDEILTTLRGEGLLERNLRLPLPLAPLRIALVTASGSEAAADVLSTLRESGYAFITELFDVRVQGAELERTVLGALEQVARRSTEFDLCIIARGGGSRVELSAWDNLGVARAVAQLPVKVFVGVGHARDTCVLDDIAVSQKTPTAAAESCVRMLDEAWHGANDLFELMVRRALERMTAAQSSLKSTGRAFAYAVDRRLAAEQKRTSEVERVLERGAVRRMNHESNRIERAAALLPRIAAQHRLGSEMQRLARAQSRLAHTTTGRVDGESKRLNRASHGMKRSTTTRIEQEQRHVLDVERLLRLVHPARTLERGFALLRDDAGSIVTAASGVQTGDNLSVEFHDGRVQVRALTPVQTVEEER
jgi:exodeoxyribonuclease VII large subunit